MLKMEISPSFFFTNIVLQLKLILRKTEVNVECKRAKYRSLVENLKSKNEDFKCVNLSILFRGIIGLSCSSFTDMCNALAVNNGHRHYSISKLCYTSVRMTCYIFYQRNKTLEKPKTPFCLVINTNSLDCTPG